MEPPPPPPLARDEYDAVISARERFTRKSRFPHFLSLPNLKRSLQVGNLATSSSVAPLPPSAPTAFNVDLINLDSSGLGDQNEYKVKYEWAIIYENQRGMTIFSVPYYSRLSLLPSDPAPFTTPNSTRDREQPPISLATYPLPDGNWQWVSKSWMIDMRSDSGEVQHDGFEYNWMFRVHKWHAEVGPLSAGGWVRRRRWVRLMMRPAKPHRRETDDGVGYSLSVEGSFNGSSSSPSIKPPDSSRSISSLDTSTIWSSNDVELNWTMCRMIMKKLGRDGRKLELWKAWLRQYQGETDLNEERGPLAWSEDDKSALFESQSHLSVVNILAESRCPPREHLVPVLRRYVCLFSDD